jgi:hypothetical protein
MTKKLGRYVRVELISSSHATEGVEKGMLGYVIEVFSGDYYEIEFSDAMTGVTLATIVAHESELTIRPEQVVD